MNGIRPVGYIQKPGYLQRSVFVIGAKNCSFIFFFCKIGKLSRNFSDGNIKPHMPCIGGQVYILNRILGSHEFAGSIVDPVFSLLYIFLRRDNIESNVFYIPESCCLEAFLVLAVI